MSRVFRLDRRAVGKISLLTAVFYFSAYFYRFFTLGYAHDSLLIDQSIDMTWQIQLGRFLQPVYLLFRGDIAVPYLIGLLAYLYLAAAICLVVDLLSLSSTLSISLVCMALCANTTLTRLHGTFHMMADSYMLALLLSVLCVFVAVRLRHGVWLAPVLLCGSAALYQSYVPVATVFFLILLAPSARRPVFGRVNRRTGLLFALSARGLCADRADRRRFLQRHGGHGQFRGLFHRRSASARLSFPL